MATAIQLDTLIGLVKESSWGTAVAVGAGNRILIGNSMDVVDGRSRAPNEEELIAGITRTIFTQGQAGISFPIVPFYRGNDLIWAILFGTRSDTVQINSMVAAYLRQYRLADSAGMTESATLAWSTNTAVEIMEAAGLMIQEVTLEGSQESEATMSVRGLCKAPINDSATNTATQINNLTFPFTCGNVGVAHFNHARLYIAKSSAGSLATVPLVSWSVSIMRGLDESNQTTKNSSNVTEIQPEVTAKVSAELTVQIAQRTGSSYEDAWEDNETYMGKLVLTDEKGAQGISVSDSTPSQDISGDGDGSIKVNIDGDGAQEISLTVATLNTGAAIAAAIQTAVRALTANSTKNQAAINNFTCTWNTDVTSKYALKSGSHNGSSSSVVVTAGGTGTDHTINLKLGTGHSGTEQSGRDNKKAFYFAELWMIENNARSIDGLGRSQPIYKFRGGICYGSSPHAEFTKSGDSLSLLQTDASSDPVILLAENETSSNPI